MKKTLIFILLVSLFAACESEKQPYLILKTESISFNYGDEYQIDLNSNISNIEYSSEDEFHATVSEDGLVTGGKVGSTVIDITADDKYEEVPVTVLAKYNTYPDPILDWTMTRSKIISKYGEPDGTTDDAIAYDNYSAKAPIIMYMFDDNDILESICVCVYTTYSSELGSFLAERYLYIDSKDYTLAFANAKTQSEATTLIGASLNSTTYWFSIYMPISSKKSYKTIDYYNNVLESLK